MPTISYESLVDEYNESLINVLRGFRPKYEFLELWVPDTDHIKSIFNLVESAKVENEKDVSLFLSEKIASELDINHLVKKLSLLSEVQIESKDRGKVINILNLNDASTPKKKTLDIDSIAHHYQKNLQNALLDLKHEGSITEEDNYTLVRSSTEGTSLFFKVNLEHQIQQAAFSGADQEAHKAILEILCSLIEGKPFQEVAEHGMIYLEHACRINKNETVVTGIQNVFNLPEMFQLPKQLLAQGFESYCQASSFQPKCNFYTLQAATAWLELSVETKIQKITESIEGYLKNHQTQNINFKVLTILKDTQIHLSIETNLSSVQKSKLLMDLERYLREHVEQTLLVYMKPWEDKNVLRLSS